MNYPATRWQDALPIGSGVVGGLIFGEIRHEIIVLNHDRLYFPMERAPMVDLSDLLPELRRLIDAGKHADATRLMGSAYKERTGVEITSSNGFRDPYQPLGSLHLYSETQGTFKDYQRQLDFSTGVASVRWADDQGECVREAFVSRQTDALHLRIRAGSAAKLSYRVELGGQREEDSGQRAWYSVKEVARPEILQTFPDEETLAFSGCYANGLAFGAVARVHRVEGASCIEGKALVISDASEINLEVRMFVGEDPLPAIRRLTREMREDDLGFESALASHVTIHRELFERTSLVLGPSETASNEQLLADAYGGEVPTALVQRLFEFGRYLLIASSGPGSWPANLQGVWNGDFCPAWNSDFHNDENIQMNYWQALPGGLTECVLPLFEYYESFLEDYRCNASMLYGCRGIFIPIAQTTHGLENPCAWTHWTGAAGWIAQHFYDYYLYTGDLGFLRDRAVPWLREVACFYEDFLVEDGGGRLQFSPSLSPENRPGGEKSEYVSINATMDVAICREVLTNLCSACAVLGIDVEGVARWEGMLRRLPAYEINNDGALKEWLHPDYADNYFHRHQSHLYPIFPGFEINRWNQPDLFEAGRVAVEKRLVIGLTSQTGWSMAHMANIYARLGMGDRALECIEILARSAVGPNLFTYHNDWRDMGLGAPWGRNPPFQIDANLGLCAAIFEMLVLSLPGRIQLLPALPAKWPTGRVEGIRCRGGFTVSLDWNRPNQIWSAQITSVKPQPLLLGIPDGFGSNKIHTSGGSPVEMCPGWYEVEMREGEVLRVDGGSGMCGPSRNSSVR